jgi:RNA polymerase sigma-32 factor
MSYLVGVRRQFVRAAMEAPFLSREEEQALAIRWKEMRDEKALHRLASAHMRLVIALAARFKNYGLSMSDMIQEGHVGLLEAAARFEPDREIRFSTYATWWIRASLQDYVLRNWSIVRGGTSSAQKALFFNFRRLRAKLSAEAAQEADSAPGPDIQTRIAEAVGVSRADVLAMEARLSGPDTSLNAPISETGDADIAQRMDSLVCQAALPDETTASTVDTERRGRWLTSALACLNERELVVLKQRRLLDNAHTLEAIGARLGVSKERVRQIENRALEKLKQALTQHHADAKGVFV